MEGQENSNLSILFYLVGVAMAMRPQDFERHSIESPFCCSLKPLGGLTGKQGNEERTVHNKAKFAFCGRWRIWLQSILPLERQFSPL